VDIELLVLDLLSKIEGRTAAPIPWCSSSSSESILPVSGDEDARIGLRELKPR